MQTKTETVEPVWISILLASLLVTAAPALSQSLDGVWQSQGYGYVFEFLGSHVKAFEVTSTTCVTGFTARLQPNPTAAEDFGGAAAFQSNEGHLFFIRPGGPKDHKLLHFENSASDVRIDRIERLPALCERLTANTPADNFEVFTRTFAEHYISFDLKQTDWGKVVAEYRSKVTSRTTPAQLFDIFEAMIRPLGDVHTSISAPKVHFRGISTAREFEGIRPGTDRILKGQSEERFQKTRMRTLFAVTQHAYLRGPVRNFCHGRIQYGHIDAQTGYLRILALFGYTESNDFTAGLAALEAALDEIFADSTLGALVIDARINFGGTSRYETAISSRLTTTEYLAYTVQARSDPIDRNKWTPSFMIMVKPSSRPGFRGPVVELIGPYTLSAGETFTEGLMGRTPRVTRIGENTQGAFSDVLERRLPNGWTFGLPNEVCRTADGTSFDGLGIPPDINVPVFADADVAAGKDPAIEKATQILGKH